MPQTFLFGFLLLLGLGFAPLQASERPNYLEYHAQRVLLDALVAAERGHRSQARSLALRAIELGAKAQALLLLTELDKNNPQALALHQAELRSCCMEQPAVLWSLLDVDLAQGDAAALRSDCALAAQSPDAAPWLPALCSACASGLEGKDEAKKWEEVQRTGLPPTIGMLYRKRCLSPGPQTRPSSR